MASVSGNIDTRQGILDTAHRIVGAKGFSGVGLNEILAAAGVPKGSFYHYFGSKEAFGEALLADYFEAYLADIDVTLAETGLNHAERLMNYWGKWQATQGSIDYQRKCLAVKLAAEVSDLSEPMRLALKAGTAGIIDRVTGAIEAGIAEGSLRIDGEPRATAETLYHLWLGASLMAKIERTDVPFHAAMKTTRRILNRQQA
ncbi:MULTISPECIES: TetR/AcrR family transcriptional regulator [Methylobacterium]|uniref:TetR/AcrR family transcriptional regulator n=1 Tax=Methylobacterium longum TaxID=767694 RepID=A0ABT8AY15_9HYPH|nr:MULTISPECIES: TetR/AcrR family transcriptional regulator [Methylobacterium]MCJ2101344.1 TetR/AcrR family transcriptional regulator [Methylobacterium sp. E-046]MDN3574482.1 TetR/AcrR family transcriptional regulator [Methylobacterium longum]GJE13783.1 HTH-type transcriptional repressor NemR [Methylobacterium longum]